MLIKRFERNATGRDLVIGDIHGHFSKLQAQLDAVGFDANAGDRLFSVGDLVDRGPESDAVLDWLDRPWFHPVLGNHEDMAIRWGRPGCRMDRVLYARNGGAWNVSNTAPERLAISDCLAALPLAIEIETADGLVGVVHADCPFSSWDSLKMALESSAMTGKQRKALRECVLWDRSRIESGFIAGVNGLRALVVGHTPVNGPTWLGNVLYIDTGAWVPGGGNFALIDVGTLALANSTEECES